MGQGHSAPQLPVLDPLDSPIIFTGDRYVAAEQTTLVAIDPIAVVGSYAIKSTSGDLYFKVKLPADDGSLRRILYDVDGHPVANTNHLGGSPPLYKVCPGESAAVPPIMGMRKETRSDGLSWKIAALGLSSLDQVWILAEVPFYGRQGELWLVNHDGDKQRMIAAFGIVRGLPNKCFITGAAGIDVSLLAVLGIAIQAEFSRSGFSHDVGRSVGVVGAYGYAFLIP
ncbi:hypothetical protein HK105_201117 [Polyrhizophydium stewartii]|uniref:Uncharacterized protein n=1 Tax=Polyrhizophydium stewartii TaxID=2732419 RepID=A0ABR4NJ34_9FUNG